MPAKALATTSMRLKLVARSQAGDGEAFCELVEPLEERLFRQAFLLCRNASQAEDLAQEALIRYGFGPGVTIQAAFNVRKALDAVGGHGTKLVVSSGFNASKVGAFIAAGAPVDAIGTGSWVDFLVFTSDIAKVLDDGQWVLALPESW